MFYYWFPKGAGWFGLGCLLIGGILDHQKNKNVKRNIAEQKAKGIGGMCVVDKDGKIKRIYG